VGTWEEAETLRVATATTLAVICCATSGVKIEHRHSVEGAETRAPENLLRMSVGLEQPDDLIADLEETLQ
jgi:cystathionine gamma-synthase